MSITLELTELSPELEKQLAGMSSEERARYAVALMEKKRAEESVEVERGDSSEEEDDSALMIGPSSRMPKAISREAMEKILALSEAPPNEPTERMKKAIENHKRLTAAP